MDSFGVAVAEDMSQVASKIGGAGQRGQSSRSSRGALSNLESFFAHASPVVPTFLPGRHASAAPIFRLGDLWASMNEMSAYGVEVPLRVPTGDVGEVVQCYVPYLSAVQLFAASGHRAASACTRGYGSDEDMDSLMSDSSTDGSECGCPCCCGGSSASATDSDCEDGNRWRGPQGIGRNGDAECRLRKAGSMGEPGRESLLFEYFETNSPHNREPLTERIAQLSSGPDGFPGLTSLRSCDIHPASWFSVAWYPLYRLPASGRTIRDLNACFLTYHSLSPPSSGEAKQGSGMVPPTADGRMLPPPPTPAADAVFQRRTAAANASGAGGSHGAAVLQPFAFAPYKMYGRTWDDDRRTSKAQLQLVAAAGMWVRRRGASHPDLDFFLANYRPRC